MPESGGKPRNASLAVVMLLVVLFALGIQSLKPVTVHAASGRVIDLFTQKAPFDGRGINQSTDAFEPQELVILYANVTYNDYPVANKLVSFSVTGPPNPIQNITYPSSNSTDQNGMAQVSFRIPWPSENPEAIVFGKWFAIATVSIADQTVIDTLTFQVGWLIRITNITTLDDQLKPQTRFLRQEMIVFNLTVESIAMTEKSGTITVDVQDATSHPIMHIQSDNLIFRPGITYLPISSQIPITATIGEASILAAVYTAPPENGGVLYSPAISSAFDIITRDVAVTAVRPSNTIVTSGESLNVTVTVKNKGNETESFNVTAYYDNTLIGRKLVAGLEPQTETSLLFDWNTSGIPTGNYIIRVVADKVQGEIEIDTYDNIFIDGTVMILPILFPFAMLDWIFLLFMFIVALIASLILLLFIGYLRRRRRKPKSHLFTVVAHPHV
jgi:hypothetical protein